MGMLPAHADSNDPRATSGPDGNGQHHAIHDCICDRVITNSVKCHTKGLANWLRIAQGHGGQDDIYYFTVCMPHSGWESGVHKRSGTVHNAFAKLTQSILDRKGAPGVGVGDFNVNADTNNVNWRCFQQMLLAMHRPAR